MKANPFIDATSSIPSIENSFSSIAPLSMLERLNGNEIIITAVERIKEAIAIGEALKTSFKFFKKVSKPKPNIKISLNDFSDKDSSP